MNGKIQGETMNRGVHGRHLAHGTTGSVGTIRGISSRRGSHARIEPSRPSRTATSVLAFVLATSLIPVGALAADAVGAEDVAATDTPVLISAPVGNDDAGAADSSAAAVSTEAAGVLKDETVYVKTAADGAVEGLYVVNRFAMGSGTVLDPGNYLYVTNLTTSQKLANSPEGVEVPLQQDAPFYYEGALEASTELPWTISLAYFLDGQEVSPSQLGGATGTVRIELTVEPNANASSANLRSFADSYVVQAQGTFDASTFEVKSREGSMMAQVGGESVINCMVLPGESATFVIEGEAAGFSSSGWQISALPLSLAIDIAEQDTSALNEATTQLQDATTQLSTGSSSLAAGASSALSGANELADGIDRLGGGASALEAGANELAAGMGNLAAGKTQAQNGWKELLAGLAALEEGASALKDGSDQYLAALESAEDEMSSNAQMENFAMNLYRSALDSYLANPSEATMTSLETALSTVILVNQAVGAQQALDQAISGYGALADGIDAAKNGAGQLAAGGYQLDDGLEQLFAGIDDAASGAAEVAGGAASVAAGTSQLSGGADQLASGLWSLGSGAGQLATGAGQLSEAVDGMDSKVLEGIQDVIDEKLGADFELCSFVEPSNAQVESVQFVYVVDGITASSSADGGDTTGDEGNVTDEADMGFIDRLLAFLKSLFSGE